MNRSVVTHHCPAWWRNHRATSRWTAGSECLRRSGRGGKRVAGAPPALLAAALPPLQPDQNTVGQYHRDRLPVEARPHPPLVLVPTQVPFGRLMELLHGMPPVGIARQLFQRGRGRQVTPGVFPLFGLAWCGTLAQQPALVPLSITRDAPARHGHKLLAQPPCGALPPATRAPLPAGHGLEQLIPP